MYSLNHYRLKWSFKLFLAINVLSEATFSLHILCRLWMTILNLFSYWLVKGFWSGDVFYTPRWISTGIVVIFVKNQHKKIWEAHWFNGTSIYRMLLANVLKFRKEDCFPVAIKFDIEITTEVKMQRSSNPVTSSLASPSWKKQEKGKASMLKQTRNRKTGGCRLWCQTSSEGWH